MDYGRNAGTASTGVPIGKVSPLKSALERHSTVIGDLQHSLSVLGGRLITIMAPIPLSEELNKAPQEKPTRLIEIIEQHTTTIEAAARRIDEIVKQLEL